MKKWLLGILSVLILAGCGQSKPTLYVYTWADYVSPDVVERFEKEYNCKVVIDTFDSNDTLLAKLKAGASGYDLITPTSYMVSILKKEGLIKEFDQTKIPNLANLDPVYQKFISDPTYSYGVPYMFGCSGIAYRKSIVDDIGNSWSIFANPKYKNKMTMLDDNREIIGAALKFLGYSNNSTDDAQLAQAKEVVLTWKRNLAKFENEQYKNGIASGEFAVVLGYSGDIRQIMDENEDVGFMAPIEGTTLQCDEFVLSSTSPNPELAHAYVNFMHDAVNAAENMQFVYYLCPNVPAYPLLSEKFRSDTTVFLPKESLEKSETVKDLGEDNAKFNKVWDEIKAAQ